ARGLLCRHGGGDHPQRAEPAAVLLAAALLHPRHFPGKHQAVTSHPQALGLDTPRTLFIDDIFEEAASGVTFETVDPSSEAVLAEAARGGPADVDRAVAAARRATRGEWRDITPAQRGQLLFRLANAILARKEEIARVETLDVGKPLKESRGDVDGVVATL